MLNEEKYYDFNDVLIKSTVSEIESRSDIDLTLNVDSKNKLFEGWRPIPVMSSNMDTITDIEMAWALLKRNWIPVLHKYVSIEDISEIFDRIDKYNLNNEVNIDYRNLFISRGTTAEDKIKLRERIEAEPRIKSVCIDIANGHRTAVLDYISELKNELCKDKILMVGNVGTEEMLGLYEAAGANIIKAGIGPGAACITRVKTGVGTPQVSLIDKLFKTSIALNSNMLIVSDGGCKVEGDIVKAFAAGSDFVMIGGMLSGYKEAPGKIELVGGIKVKRFSGMAAKESQHKGVPKHGTEEGKTVFVPYKGKVYHKLIDIEGGIRSACTYTNSFSINELKNAELILTNVQENKIFS